MTTTQIGQPNPLPPRVLLLPGWLGSDGAHWQRRWQALHGDELIEQDDWKWPRRGDWMARLEEALIDPPGSDGHARAPRRRPVLLAAHSLGCHLVAAWAAHSANTRLVAGALLVAPPDLDRADMPPQIQHTWRPPVRQRLPFRSTLLWSSDDPYCSAERALELADGWGAVAHAQGPRGHLNGDSGLADWPQGRQHLMRLTTATPQQPHAGRQ